MKAKLLLSFLFFVYCTQNLFAQGVWTQKASFIGTARGDAFSFSIGTKGYIGGGQDISGNYVNDFWEYNTVNNTWTQKTNFIGGARYQSVSFNIGSKGYVCTGQSSVLYNDCWEYDPSTDL